MKIIWKLIGLSSLVLGIIGIFVPLLPTTPFLILSAFAFEKSSEKLHKWLMEHPQLGPPIEDWKKHKAISKKAKIYAVVSIGCVFLFSIFMQVPMYALGIQALILTCVSIFILTRPVPPE